MKPKQNNPADLMALSGAQLRSPRKDEVKNRNTLSIEALITEHEVARATGLSVASVRRWRLLRQGPKYMKIGASVRYKPDDLAAWLESRPTGGEAIQKGLIDATE